MPVIVIVLMFLVAFLLAVIAMIAAPFLGVGYALWSRNNQNFQEDCAAAFPGGEPKNNVRASNTAYRGSK